MPSHFSLRIRATPAFTSRKSIQTARSIQLGSLAITELSPSAEKTVGFGSGSVPTPITRRSSVVSRKGACCPWIIRGQGSAFGRANSRIPAKVGRGLCREETARRSTGVDDTVLTLQGTDGEDPPGPKAREPTPSFRPPYSTGDRLLSPTTLAPEQVVSRDPKIRDGDLVFAGTRVPVRIVLAYLKRGSTLEEFHENYPTVDREQLDALLELGIEALDPAARA